nr:YigZ family protein [Bacteroidaceae bacterium]
TVDGEYSFSFEHPLMNKVMKVVRDMDARIVSQSFDMDCQMTLSIPKGLMPQLKEKIGKALSPF